MNKLLTCAACAATFLWGAGAIAQTVIKLGHAQPTTHSIGIAAEEFSRLVEERTKGEVIVKVHPNGELGGSRQLAEGVRLGTIDIIITGAPFWSRFEPILNVLDLPYLFGSREHAHAVADSEIGSELLDRLQPHGVQGLAYYEIGYRNVTNSRGPVKTPADLKAMKIRVSPNKAHTLAFQLWGANPVAMSFSEVYLALQTGAVDGQENPIHIIATGRLSEVQKYLTVTNHAYSNSIMAMNLRRFKTLTDEQQKIMIETARETGVLQRKINSESLASYLQQLKDEGMEVIEDVDHDAFAAIVKEPVWTAFAEENEGGQEYIDRILAMNAGN